jgi:hypothetical protein
MARPSRTFNGTAGQPSSGVGGPDQIEYDLGELCAALDPDKTHADGSQGGIGWEHCKDEIVNHIHTKGDITDWAHTHPWAIKPSNTVLWSYTPNEVAGKADGSRIDIFRVQLPKAGRYRVKGTAVTTSASATVTFLGATSEVVTLTDGAFNFDMAARVGTDTVITFYTEGLMEGETLTLTVSFGGEDDTDPQPIVL